MVIRVELKQSNIDLEINSNVIDSFEAFGKQKVVWLNSSLPSLPLFHSSQQRAIHRSFYRLLSLLNSFTSQAETWFHCAYGWIVLIVFSTSLGMTVLADNWYMKCCRAPE
ncbi:hypothetical protein H5410_006268 [Solanum commersonii]|uniref:Uncharacterized protein n=1 Tax=Solanum commersonii TaxID=4109 RepID=A0A9J6A9X9_SOLCO|nr:hypothetical protein H5410_006268 [Solanum commersonii]